ncbi:MAG: DUF4810 domain-containing protein [Prevotellaceae bacterium]|jgi:hypothetical protein|nr:DUF4810 domain-containing protein [Prevotellaceae bacterium]
MKQLLITTAICATLLSGCAPATLYSWGRYQSAAYSYTKNNTDENATKLGEAYQSVISHPGGKRNVVPPGLYADYGYLLFRQGKTKEALDYLKMEIGLYPESTVFIGRIIKQLEK